MRVSDVIKMLVDNRESFGNYRIDGTPQSTIVDEGYISIAVTDGEAGVVIALEGATFKEVSHVE
jgi:hypothetical protein